MTFYNKQVFQHAFQNLDTKFLFNLDKLKSASVNIKKNNFNIRSRKKVYIILFINFVGWLNLISEYRNTNFLLSY